jgi:hypothetical protein
MPPPSAAADTEDRFRRMLEDNDLPQPDEVERRDGELVFLYHEKKVAIVVELEDPD